MYKTPETQAKAKAEIWPSWGILQLEDGKLE